MKRTRQSWIAVILAAGMLMPATAASAKGTSDVDIITSDLAAVVKGTESWVALTYTAESSLESVTITVESRTDGVTVAYPENTSSHTSFWTDDALEPGEIDFSAFEVSVDEGVADKVAKLRVTLEGVAIDAKGKSKSENVRWDVKLPLVEYSGANVEQITEALGTISVGESRWVEIAYAGLAPSTDNFATTVNAPGLSVVYPGEGTQTSLHHDATLDLGETDVVRVLVDATGVAPGNYEVNVGSSFDGGTIDSVLPLEVVPGT